MAANGFDGDQTRSYRNLAAGTKVSHYIIVSRSVPVSMGEVYLTEDTKLKRQVAPKLIPIHLATEKDSEL